MLYYPFGMIQPGRTYSAGIGYRYGFNKQEKSEDLGSSIMTAQFWEYDSRIGRRWNLDPKPNISISPYNCFAGNPIFNTDFNGDTLSISSNQQTRDDISNQVSPENQGFINLPAAGRDDVTLKNSIKVGDRTITLREAMRKDKGLANLFDLINDTHNYFYNATYRRNAIAIDLDPLRASPNQVLNEDISTDPVFAVGNPVSTAVARPAGGYDFYRTFENNSFTLRGDEAKELSNYQIVPNKTLMIGYVQPSYARKYDGTIRIAPGEFQQQVNTPAGVQINQVRSKIIYHELRENYYRVNGFTYAEAHAQAMIDYTGGVARTSVMGTPIVSEGDMLKSAANTTRNSTLIYIRR